MGWLSVSFLTDASRADPLCDALMAAARAALAPLFETPHFALSLEVQEIDAVLTWKDNAMHGRLRNK